MTNKKIIVIDETERYKMVSRVGIITVIINIIIASVKVIVGIVANSNAILADGVHTISDIITTVAVIVGVKFSSKPSDEGHPYGHERIESVVSKMLSIFLMITALGIGYSVVLAIVSGTYNIPGRLAVIVAVLSILVKEWMYHYTIKVADNLDSAALKADAWHHRSDAFSSVGTLIGVVGARLGFMILDPIASIIVCLLIIKVGVNIFVQSFNQVVDRAADKSTINEIKEAIWDVKGVKSVDMVKTRMHGTKIYVDVEISVNPSSTVSEGHTIAENVHDKIENNILNVKHCMVHVNPYKIEKKN